MQTRQLNQGELLQGRYRIKHELGAGGFARVYLAEDVRLGNRPVAVKIMSLEQLPAGRRDEAPRQFQAEARLLARLDHPGIVDVYDFFDEGNEFYLVMEYVAGQTLAHYLQHQGGRLSEREALALTAQIGSVLHHLHQQQDPTSGQSRPIIYRDLKPANVMIRPDGSVRLLDFGIARIFKPGQTSDTQHFGTPGYAAPEQYGHGQTDARADVYSLGVLLHQMLSGHDPASSPMHLPPLAGLVPEVSPRVAGAVEQATAVHPDERFFGIQPFAGALGIPLPTTGSLGGAYPREAQETQVIASEEKKKKSRWPLYTGIAILIAAGLSIVLFLVNGESGDSPPPTASATGEARQAGVMVTATGVARREGVVVTATGLAAKARVTAAPTATEAAAEEEGKEGDGASDDTPLAATPALSPTPSPAPVETATLPPIHTGRDGVRMLLVPAGQFLMGSTRQQVEVAMTLCQASGDNDPCNFSEFANEMPQRSVYLDAFYINETEISNEAYRQCVAAGGCRTPAYRSGRYPLDDYYDNPLYGNHPVIHVRWDQARDYCTWAGERLPTEAEWEKAARGSEGHIFPWGDAFDPDLANTQERGGDQLKPVGSYPGGASPYGVQDMAGSVWEWVADTFDANYYGEAPDRNPPAATRGGDRVLRGGSYSNFRHYARTTNRGFEDPATSSAYRGFRCVLPAAEVTE